MPKPIPVPDESNKPFWDACNEGRLVVQNCTACNKLQYPPAQACAACGTGDNLVWHETSGRGRIQGYVVEHDTRMAPLYPDQPFNIAVIELEDDPKINFLSHLPDIPVDQVPVGAEVEVFFPEVGEGQKIHEWRVAPTSLGKGANYTH